MNDKHYKYHYHWQIRVDLMRYGFVNTYRHQRFCMLENCPPTPRVKTIHPKTSYRCVYPGQLSGDQGPPLGRDSCVLINKRILQQQGIVIMCDKHPFTWRKLTAEERIEQLLEKHR